MKDIYKSAEILGKIVKDGDIRQIAAILTEYESAKKNVKRVIDK